MDKKEDDFEDKFLSLDEVESVIPVAKVKTAKPKKVEQKTLKSKNPKNKKLLPKKLLVGIGIFLVTLLIMIVASGLIKIPILSQIFYRSPKPAVVISNVLPTEIDKSKNGVDFNQDSGILTVKIAQEYLTGALRQYYSRSTDPQFDQNVQIFINQDHVEFYGTLLYPVKTELTFWFEPNLSDLSLTKFFKVTKFKVGNLRLPSIIAKLAFKEYIESKLKSLTSAFGAQGSAVSFSNQALQLRSISLGDGYVTVAIYIDQERLQENLKQIPQFLEQFQNFAATKAEPVLTPTSTQP